MKVDLMYSIHYVPHPFDKEANKAGVYVYALCREVRLPVEVGAARGRQVSWEPIAEFRSNNEAGLFEEFCLSSSIPLDAIEPSAQFLEARGVRLPRRTA